MAAYTAVRDAASCSNGCSGAAPQADCVMLPSTHLFHARLQALVQQVGHAGLVAGERGAGRGWSWSGGMRRAQAVMGLECVSVWAVNVG